MPNSNVEAEQAVLGSLLLSREKYPEVDAVLSSSDFESEVHKEIYECIKSIADKGKPIDHITVSKQLDRNNALQRVGGLDYLKELQEFKLTWSSNPGTSYLISTSDDLKTWTNDPTNLVTASGVETTFSLSSDKKKYGYFRVNIAE